MLPGFEFAASTRGERKQQMLDVLFGAGGSGLPASQLFKRVGLKRTPYSTSILAELVDEAQVIFEQHYLTNGMPVRLYWHASNYQENLPEGLNNQEQLPW